MKSKDLHPAIPGYAQAARDGKLDRREFLALASIFRRQRAAAYGMIGMPQPGRGRGGRHA